jgi:methionyl-tRNA formyltransferase
MNESSAPFVVGFCGSGEYSVRCAQALAQDDRFSLAWVVCPPPRPAGRGKKLQASALQLWAESHNIPVFLVETSLQDLHEPLLAATPIDYLLVVSFGYLVPAWLLSLPKIAPVNVHPSALPKYRGSSPAQFALLYGEKDSSVSIMTMNTKFDEGAIITQLPLPLTAEETQTTYYDRAFALASAELANVLATFAETRTATPQLAPEKDAVLARRLAREDGFVPYEFLQAAQKNGSIETTKFVNDDLSPALRELVQHQPTLPVAEVMDRAVRALTPWPGVWTIVPEYKGRENVRLKIVAGRLNVQKNYEITTLQYEGESQKNV